MITVTETYSIGKVFDCGVVDPDEFLEWMIENYPDELERYIQEYVDGEDSNEEDSEDEIEYYCKIDNKHLEVVSSEVVCPSKYAEWRRETGVNGLLGGKSQFEESHKKTLKRIDGGTPTAFGVRVLAKVFDNNNKDREYNFRTFQCDESTWLDCVYDEETKMMFFIPDEYVVRV